MLVRVKNKFFSVATTGERDNEINISGLDNCSICDICQSSDTEEL